MIARRLITGSSLLFWALKWVVWLFYWSLRWNNNKNWQNKQKPEYLPLILVQANFSLFLFFCPLFVFLGLIQLTLGSKLYLDKIDTFSNWQKGRFSVKSLGLSKRRWCVAGQDPRDRGGCHLGRQGQKYWAFQSRSYWYSPENWPVR